MLKDNLTKLKSEILSDDFEVGEAARKQLIKTDRKKALNFFISLLRHQKQNIRDAAAISLRELRDERATPHLMKAVIKNPAQAGTLVYALEKHDCALFFLKILNIALYGNYEMQSHALIILKEQKFKVTKKELSKAQDMIRAYEGSKTKVKDYKVLLDEVSRYLKKIEKHIKFTVPRPKGTR